LTRKTTTKKKGKKEKTLMHHGGMGLSIRAPFPQGMLRWCSIKCFTKGSWNVIKRERERMVFGEYKRNNKTTIIYPKRKKES
jgi:hypothetical protein